MQNYIDTASLPQRRGAFSDLKYFTSESFKQNFGFLCVCAYLVLSYARPQVIYPALNFLPWTQIVILAGLGHSLLTQGLKYQISHFALTCFFVAVLISTYNSLYPTISSEKLDLAYIWLIEVFFFTNCVRNSHQLKLALILFFLIAFKMSFHGARTWASRGFGFANWGLAGPPGFFANSGEFSLLMAMVAVMSIAVLAGNKENPKLYLLLPITAVMTVLGASSRGSQLALVIALVYLAVTIGKVRFRTILYCAVVGYLTFILIPEEQMERFSSMGEDSTSQSRLNYWSAGLDMMDKHPWFGVGHYGFPTHYKTYYSYNVEGLSEFLRNREEVEHNSLVQVGSTLGYVGLCFYLWLFYLCFSFTRKTRKLLTPLPDPSLWWMYRFSIGLDAATITYFVGSFFMSVAFYPYIYLLLMLTQVLYNCAKMESNKELPAAR